jgi:hypothetical protein
MTSTAEWELVPGKGFGFISLGEARDSVRNRLGPYKTFERVAGASPTDHFERQGLHVKYDDAGKVAFIEVGAPGDPTIEGVRVVGRRLADVARELSEKNLSIAEEHGLPALPEWNVRLFAPAGTVESLSIRS